MNKTSKWLICSWMVSVLLIWNSALAEPAIGWVDTAKIYPGGIKVRARMDSGAKTSSLRAESLQNFERNGEAWIKIAFINRKRGKTYHYVSRIVRYNKIKNHHGKPEIRPVIMLGICIGKVYKEVETTIALRNTLNYPLLIGRNYLAGSYFIDSARTFTIKPACSWIPK